MRGQEGTMNRKLLGFVWIIAILVAVTGVVSAQTVDTLVFDYGDLFPVAVVSQKLPHSAVLQLTGDLTPEAANPSFACRGSNPFGLAMGINTTPFTLTYDDGFVAEGSGSILFISHIGLPGPVSRPWGDHSFVAHLTVRRTSEVRTGPWPQVGDLLTGAGELSLFELKGEGTYRLVRR